MTPTHRIHFPGVPPRGVSPAPADAWEIVERFARNVPRCEKACRRKLAVEAVRDGIQAEAVYWYPGTSDDSVEIAGRNDLPADWCVRFAKKLIEGTPGLDGRLLCSVLPRGRGADPLQPASAALVRVSRSHSSWIVALNFGERRLQPADLKVMGVIRQIFVNQRQYCDLTSRMTETLSSLVQCLTTSIDAHLPHTRGHSGRVAKLSVALGKRMRLPALVLNDLYFAGLVHDIGITAVPQSVLLKPTRLSDEEFATVRAYPVQGDAILANIRPLAHLRLAVRHHHERYDGRGYPDGLAGDRIPLLSRILGVADAFDAMHSPRPYRPALPTAEVDDILQKGAGKQWDPDVVEQYLLGRPHLQAFRQPSTEQLEPSLQYVVPAWHGDSSGKVGTPTPDTGLRPSQRLREVPPL